ncbi:MAG TPA: hypothetical protein VF575_05255 [Candidatus Saccharimonadales bacterium]|jgi:hypothetical protein
MAEQLDQSFTPETPDICMVMANMFRNRLTILEASKHLGELATLDPYEITVPEVETFEDTTGGELKEFADQMLEFDACTEKSPNGKTEFWIIREKTDYAGRPLKALRKLGRAKSWLPQAIVVTTTGRLDIATAVDIRKSAFRPEGNTNLLSILSLPRIRSTDQQNVVHGKLLADLWMAEDRYLDADKPV